MTGTLYLVATPIGNLEDITYRAVRILHEVDLIACEDTRHTRNLLDRYGVAKPVVSYHEHNEAARSEELVEKLSAGTNIALVSDAGTPLVSDPGYRVVAAAIRAGIRVVPIPGPSAALAALAGAGLATSTFYFGGFLPPKSGQRARTLEALRDETATVIFYEAPYRILETLSDVEKILGPRPVVVARELTKVHEEFLRGHAGEVRALLASRPSVKGEITLLIGKSEAPASESTTIEEDVEMSIRAGMTRMDAIKEVARKRGLAKREVYRRAQRETPLEGAE
ncbi:MAG TPA: 16S rRNA (cytidine(1402)-2'-O)-methyltransferase [Bryobacteraceae bacterium]|nr:16S rRNA (cytidine(1402)-2'-O)-methyltransferase [Bryobacteraceae bacterium]